MTPGQRRAVAELESLANLSDNAIVITGPGMESDSYVKVPIRLSTEGTRHYPGGLRFDAFENLEIWIGSDAPLYPPLLVAPDARWSTSPHVTGRSICLYIDPATQWSPSDGMYGFVHRIGEWFVAAAAGELDPDNGPIHPPVPLGLGFSNTKLVINAEVPESEHKRLLWANLEPRDRERIDVTAFHRHGPKATDRLGAVILTNLPLVGDYARTYGALSRQLEDLGFRRLSLVKHLIETAQRNPSGTPLVVIMGTLNRRIDRRRFHHLVGWELPADLADRFRQLAETDSDLEIEQTLDAANQWAADAELEWTRMYEARPSVTQRRDHRTPMAGLSGKTIEIWGCGALGGWLAEFIARAKPAAIRLRDWSTVGPGLVVRQPYDDPDISRPKAAALADRLRRIHNNMLDIDGVVSDLTRIHEIAADLATVDLIVDATANRSVAAALDRYAAAHPDHPPIVSVTTDADCDLTALFSAPAGSAGPGYTARAALQELRRSPVRAKLIEAFWGSPTIDDLVQPEPGCSAPTFHGSAADAARAASTLANQVAAFLHDPDRRISRFTGLMHSSAASATNTLEFETSDPTRIAGAGNYTVFLSPTAQATIERYAFATFESADPVETGGLLLGERDDAALSITIDTATGPAPDSTHSRFGFERGIEGTDELMIALARDEMGGANYLGDWHTHPHGVAAASATDRSASEDRTDGASLILIWAGTPDNTTWAAHVFDSDPPGPPAGAAPTPAPPPVPAIRPKAQPKKGGRAALGPCRKPMPLRRPLPPVRPNRPAILVALSGGGFRATLAGLGVLRFLVDADLIQDTRIVSSVSGGSLANAIMATNWDRAGAQPGFDHHVLLPTLDKITTRSLRTDLIRNSWRSLRPGSSRTKVLAGRLDRRFLNGTMLEELPEGCWFMLNATNISEGVRFRFDADVIGDYVNGSIPTVGSGTTLATAVAASAAVPGPFPPLQLDQLDFPCDTGNPILLADGGVYDNLGLEAIQREREEFESSFLLSLNAGSQLTADLRSGLGRLPIAGNLWRANAVMHRQTSGLRTRRLFQESTDANGRPFATFNLATEFPDNLSRDQQARLEAWRQLNAEHPKDAREALAAIPTTFARIEPADALALVQRAWWLTGATLMVHHPWLLELSPTWRDPNNP